MSEREAPIFHEIKTPEEGTNYVATLVYNVVAQRALVDKIETYSAEGMHIQTSQLQTEYRKLMILYGQALGALVTLVHCRVISEAAYSDLREMVMEAIATKVLRVIP